MIMGSSKNPKKSKWLVVCFKPNEESLEPKKGSQKSPLHQKILIGLSNEKPDSSPDKDGCRSMPEKSRRRKISRVFRDIFSNTSSLAKKKRNKKSGKDASRSSSDLSSKFEKIFNTSGDKKLKSSIASLSLSSLYKESSDSDTSVSCCSSLFSSTTTLASSSRSASSSSLIPTTASNSRTGSGRKQTCAVDLKELKPNKPVPPRQKKKEGGNCNSEIVLYFMLICLVGLIFWGKAFSILCTSTCLFLVPSIFKGVAVEVNDVGFIDFDSDEYKKKVILEGLLERNRTRKL